LFYEEAGDEDAASMEMDLRVQGMPAKVLVNGVRPVWMPDGYDSQGKQEVQI